MSDKLSRDKNLILLWPGYARMHAEQETACITIKSSDALGKKNAFILKSTKNSYTIWARWSIQKGQKQNIGLVTINSIHISIRWRWVNTSIKTTHSVRFCKNSKAYPGIRDQQDQAIQIKETKKLFLFYSCRNLASFTIGCESLQLWLIKVWTFDEAADKSKRYQDIGFLPMVHGDELHDGWSGGAAHNFTFLSRLAVAKTNACLSPDDKTNVITGCDRVARLIKKQIWHN